VVDHLKPKRAVMFTVIPWFIGKFESILNERGHKLVGIVTAPGPRTRRSEEYREIATLARPGLDVIISNYPHRWADMIRPLKPDLIFCAGFNWVLPVDVLEVPPLGVFNIHDSLLPKNRGLYATSWALRTGHPHGITFHRMTPGLDSGPILAQREVVIGDDEDLSDITPRLQAAREEGLAEALDRVLEGFPGIPQDESEARYTPGAFEPEWREIQWDRPVKDVFFKIRSWSGLRGVPLGAFGEVDGERLLITKAKPMNEQVELNDATPGTVLTHNDGEILIQCADGPLRIIDWQVLHR
jgi:methionyl-tRNA formyltransferase